MVDRSSAKVLSDLVGIGLISATRIHARPYQCSYNEHVFFAMYVLQFICFLKVIFVNFVLLSTSSPPPLLPPFIAAGLFHAHFLTSFTKIISAKKTARECRKTNISCLPAKLFIFHINWCTHFDTLHACGCREHLNATEKKNTFFMLPMLWHDKRYGRYLNTWKVWRLHCCYMYGCWLLSEQKQNNKHAGAVFTYIQTTCECRLLASTATLTTAIRNENFQPRKEIQSNPKLVAVILGGWRQRRTK